MIPDTVDSVVTETAPPRRRFGPSRPAVLEGLAGRLLARDLLGVRLGVLLLVLPIFTSTIWLAVAGRGIWNHPPDSRYYLTMMSRDMGHPLGASVRQEQAISPDWPVAPWYFADNDPTWQMVRTRMFYPALSIPFVWMFGLKVGSLVVPIASTFVFVWVVARVLQRLYSPAVAVIVTAVFAFVYPIYTYCWAGTDTLAMALAAVIVANLPIERRIGKANLVWLGAATVFIALTRQVGVLAPAMAGAGWLWALVRERSWRNRWLGSFAVTAVATVVTQIASMLYAKPDTAGVISQGETTVWGIAHHFIHEMKVVTGQAMTYMWQQDRELYAMLIAAGVAVLLRFKSDATAVFVGAVGATYLITAGVGYSTHMRYEMIMFPAGAVAAGALVSLALGEPVARTPGPLDDWAPRPRENRWIPQAAFNAVLLVVVLAVSIPGGSRSSVAVPTSPSYAAAQGGQDYALQPVAKPPAETTIKAALAKATDVVKGNGFLDWGFDWVHPIRYRPTAAGQPGWSQRDADGTTLTYANNQTEERTGMEAFANAITFNGTVLPDTVKIMSRQTSAYGEDVEFTVRDIVGVTHRGTATTVYPVFKPQEPGVLTAIVYEP